MKKIKLLILSFITILTLTHCTSIQSKAENAIKVETEQKALVPIKLQFGTIDTAKILFSQTKDCNFLNKKIDSLNHLSLELTNIYVSITEKHINNLTVDNDNILNIIKTYEDTTLIINNKLDNLKLEILSIKTKIKDLDFNTKPLDGYKLVVYKSIDDKTKIKTIYYFDKNLNIIDSKIPEFESLLKNN